MNYCIIYILYILTSPYCYRPCIHFKGLYTHMKIANVGQIQRTQQI